MWLAACQSLATDKVQTQPMEENSMPTHTEAIFQSHHCGVNGTPSAQWITDAEQYKKTFYLLHKHMIMQKAPDMPSVDFGQFGVLLVSMGRQRTGGFSLRLAETPAEQVGDELTVNVQWREPAPGAFVTQALTSPCLLVKVSKGGFSRIVVKDQNGKERARVNVP
jgi:hypothetical protein